MKDMGTTDRENKCVKPDARENSEAARDDCRSEKRKGSKDHYHAIESSFLWAKILKEGPSLEDH
jgi:hypothetical protein